MRKLHLHGALQEQGKRTNQRIRILRMSKEEDIYEQTTGNSIKLHFCMRNTTALTVFTTAKVYKTEV